MKCPLCKSKNLLTLHLSVCTEEECCGIDHKIICEEGTCLYKFESPDYHIVEVEWRKLGGRIFERA